LHPVYFRWMSQAIIIKHPLGGIDPELDSTNEYRQHWRSGK